MLAFGHLFYTGLGWSDAIILQPSLPDVARRIPRILNDGGRCPWAGKNAPRWEPKPEKEFSIDILGYDLRRLLLVEDPFAATLFRPTVTRSPTPFLIMSVLTQGVTAGLRQPSSQSIKEDWF